MRYESLGKMPRKQLRVPQLVGGLNCETDAALIADDELTAVCNLTLDQGVLRTREALMPLSEQSLIYDQGIIHFNTILHEPIVVDNTLCTVVVTEASVGSTQSQESTVQVVTLDGKCLHKYTLSGVTSAQYHMAVAACDKHTHGAAFLLFRGGEVYMPDDTSGTMKAVGDEKVYAPLVAVGTVGIFHTETDKPSAALANGTRYESFNALTRRYRVMLSPRMDATSTVREYYCLPTELMSNSKVTLEVVTDDGVCKATMTVGGKEVGFAIKGTECVVQAFSDGYISVAPALKSSVVTSATVTCERKTFVQGALFKVSKAAWFGGTQNTCGGSRLFLANASQSSLIWSDVNNPFYFPESNTMSVGDPSSHITALCKQGDMLVIFKDREIYYTTYVQGEIQSQAIIDGTSTDVTASQAYFPLTQLSPLIGCRCPGSIVLCRDRLVWLDEDARIYTLVVSGAYSERNVREIGGKIRPLLLHTTVEQRQKASAMDHRGKYRLMIGSRMVEFNYHDSGFANIAGYASGERAARNIAWMAQHFEGLENTVSTLISDGADTALIINTCTVVSQGGIVRMCYTLDASETSDCYITMDTTHTLQKHTQPIVVSLTTKTFEFGDVTAYKRIFAFFPMMTAEDARLRFVADGYCASSGVTYRSDALWARRVMPCVGRCRTFAVEITATGACCIKGMAVQYGLFGTVR